MGLKKNIGFNLILTFANYLIPLIVYPYISRVLEVDNIGLCNFIDNIINYFILFSMAGISSYGVREIARCKDNPQKLSNVFSSLMTLNIILTGIALIALTLSTAYISELRENRQFIAIGSIKIIFNIFLIEWFYQGLENFKFITIRTLIIKTAYICGVFLFIKEKSDVLIYFGLLTLTTVLNSIINFTYSRKFVKITLSLKK